MELRTTVRNFARDILYHHISSNTRIRVIIDEPQALSETVPNEKISVPHITPTEQRRRLNGLPQGYDPHASDELISLIESSHVNTEMSDDIGCQ